MLFLWTAFSGWVATLLLAGGVSIPYFVRATPTAVTPYLKRLRPHYWVGFLIPAVAFAHAWLPMSAGHMRGYDQTGLWLATAALFVMLWQVVQGLALRAARGAARRADRNTHFWTMGAIALLVIGHIILNRA